MSLEEGGPMDAERNKTGPKPERRSLFGGEARQMRILELGNWASGRNGLLQETQSGLEPRGPVQATSGAPGSPSSTACPVAECSPWVGHLLSEARWPHRRAGSDTAKQNLWASGVLFFFFLPPPNRLLLQSQNSLLVTHVSCQGWGTPSWWKPPRLNEEKSLQFL